MTTITINLPDSLTSDLKAKATAWKMSLDEVLQEAAVQFILNDDSQIELTHLMPEELVALELAQADLAAGRTVSHDEAMAHFRAALTR
jgi:predicted transcriptional regulator